MNFGEEPTALRLSEFVAIVLVGEGDQLLPLTSANAEGQSPKALVPIANRAMIDYALTWLEPSGITEVVVVCPAAHRAQIAHHIHSATAYPSLAVAFTSYEPADQTGTCAALLAARSRVGATADFVVLPCDFIPPPDLVLHTLLDAFRVAVSADGAVAQACYFAPATLDKGAVPEEWGSTAPATASIVWDAASASLLHVDTEEDAERDGAELALRMALVARFPRTRLARALQDSHVYVCRREVLDALALKPHMESFAREFVPWLCKLQYQRTKQMRYGSVFRRDGGADATALRHATLALPKRAEPWAEAPPADARSDALSVVSAPSSPIDRSDESGAVQPSLRIGMHVHRGASAGRANTLPALLELNRRFLGQTPYVLPTDQKDRALIDARAQIAPDSLVGESTVVGERTIVKRSVVGRHCVLARGARVLGCVLLDHVVVGENAKLEGCILGAGTKVGAKADLKGVVTQGGYEVGAGETARNEKLETSSWAAEGSEESEEEESEEEEESDE